MANKEEIIKFLTDKGVSTEGLTWPELQKLYAQHNKPVAAAEPTASTDAETPTESDAQAPIESESAQGTDGTDPEPTVTSEAEPTPTEPPTPTETGEGKSQEEKTPTIENTEFDLEQVKTVLENIIEDVENSESEQGKQSLIFLRKALAVMS